MLKLYTPVPTLRVGTVARVALQQHQQLLLIEVAWDVGRGSGAFCRWGRPMPLRLSSGKRPPTPLSGDPVERRPR
ncbi:MAG: hypothetical protein JNL18_14215 [Planctomycetaceae bacterium]|nr:hypothetical protein [Planctomycetaceae bacterium]